LGAAQALHLTIDVLRFPGCNILLPRPGFSLYEAICSYFNVEARFYDLLGDSNWEIDLHHVEALADDNTIAIIICNPGNPCGSVFSYQHLAQVATLAGELKMSIIADEVYAKMVFGKTPFVSMATFSTVVPVIAIGSISKGWLATGWRLGWIAMWDPHGILKKAQIPEGILTLMQIESGPCTPIQATLPDILHYTPNSEFEKTCEHLRLGSDLSYVRASKIKGLSVPTRPEGSMFMMVKLDIALFDNISSDTEFTLALLREESVLVLPGIAFGIPDWFRIVFALSLPQLGAAWDRIGEFCSRHVRQN
jgi:tyrosine aminotransferase